MTWRDAFELPFQADCLGVYIYDDNERVVLNVGVDEDYRLKILNVLNGGKEYFIHLPFTAEDGRIRDSAGKVVLVVRGWGYLTGTGGLNLSPEEAAKIQDELQEWIVNKLNGKME